MFKTLNRCCALGLFVLLAAASCSGDANPAKPSAAPASKPAAARRRSGAVRGQLAHRGERAAADRRGAGGCRRSSDLRRVDHLRRRFARRPLGPAGTQDRIAAGGWRWVVLQQGPSALPESRVNLREWTRRFDAVIRQAGGVTALYMVWPESSRRNAFPDVSASYRLAAQDVDGILLPAGDAWLAAWRLDPSLPLYGSDGFHPSALVRTSPR